MSLFAPASGLLPDLKDTAGDSLKKINALQARQAGLVPTGGTGSPAATSTAAQGTVTNTASVILAAGAAAFVSIFNNGTEVIYFDEGGATPVADSGGTAGPRVGDGYGKELAPGNLWESPRAITTAIKAITKANTSKITVTIYPV